MHITDNNTFSSPLADKLAHSSGKRSCIEVCCEKINGYTKSIAFFCFWHANMPSEKLVYQPHHTVSQNAHVSTFAKYQEMYQKSIDNPEEFWGDIAKEFHWETPIDINKFFRYNFNVNKGPIYTKWLDGATTNICYNVLDRHVKNGLGDKVAFYWWALVSLLHFTSVGLICLFTYLPI